MYTTKKPGELYYLTVKFFRPATQWLNLSTQQAFFLTFLENLFLIGGQLLYNIVLASAIQQCESAINIHISSPSQTSPHPPSELATEYLVELPVLPSNFPLAICFTYDDVNVPVLLLVFPTLSFPCSVQSLFSMSASLFLPCR
ncbi:unnamed protein product [Rangifer tarandus platyrhynchus]|uniref:Uncharacterized protein n=1 Tax=Rangifer tarandus platyrhynchus TaxID=3082113 RepID=A0AC60A0T3_RANTA